PVSSYDDTDSNSAIPPNTDIANAVQFLRFHADTLRIDPNNIFLAGQSRGSLGVLTALLPDQKDPKAGKSDWRSQSSTVNAVLGYQAQTTYDVEEKINTFVNKNQDNMRCEGSYITGQPGSALQQVENGATLVPMRLTYDEVAPNPNKVVKQCYHQCTPRCASPRPGCPKTCSDSICNNKTSCSGIAVTKYFDVHDHNFSVALRERYRDRNQESLITTLYNLGGPQGGYKGYIDFFNLHLNNPRAAIQTDPPDSLQAIGDGSTGSAVAHQVALMSSP
ncbi:MAG: hypothetical protein WCD18_26885, partial [Thermosynechococcaceae cyanobacterium]